MPEALVVANPAAANGRLGRRWAAIANGLRRQLPTDHAMALTEGPGHAEEIVRDALRAGVSLVVTVGGDGTFHEVTNGFFEPEGGAAIQPEARLALVPFGTGGDLKRTLRIPADLEAAIARVGTGSVRAVDVGLATYRHRDGREARRHFINVADFGVGGAVVEKVNRTTKRFGGALSFLWAIVTTLPTHRNTRVRWRADGREGEVVMQSFIVANGRHFGGGLTPAPHAEMDDGLLDVVVIGDVTLREAIADLGKLRRGKHLTNPKISVFQATTVETECLEPALLDLDGELSGSNPTRFEVRPGALRVVV